jgi:hypothetical protein
MRVFLGLAYGDFCDGDLFRCVLNVQIGLLDIEADSLPECLFVCPENLQVCLGFIDLVLCR